MRGLYWEDWEIGQEFVSPARTITEADIVMFAGLSGDYNPLHINEEYCKTTQFGTRIAHGPLIYAIAAGLVFQLHLYDDTLIAFLGFDSSEVHQADQDRRHRAREAESPGETRDLQRRPRRNEAAAAGAQSTR